MRYDPAKHHRRSIRLRGYDYASPGRYYLTICTYERQFLFGEIVREQMRPSEIGAIAEECWNEIPQHFPRSALDVSVVMPNHLHGIIIVGGVGARHGVSLSRPAAFGKAVPGSLGTLVGLFKQAVTRRVRVRHGARIDVWHENYYEHIIRNEKELNRIWEYIRTNPLRWRYDVENPACDRRAADDIEEILNNDE
jgi:REP element-mobilizing transposase RayT